MCRAPFDAVHPAHMITRGPHNYHFGRLGSYKQVLREVLCSRENILLPQPSGDV